MSNLYNIGVRGLLAYQTALVVTGTNIANIKTPYYARRQINFAEDVVGGGVSVSDISRIYRDTTSVYLQKTSSNMEMSDIYSQQVSELETLLGDSVDDKSKSTINTYLTDALKALRDLNGSTSSLSSRTVYLNKLSALGNRVNDITSQISQRQENINQSLTVTVGTVNQIAKQIADLNQQIANFQGDDISPLLDLREVQVQELSKYIDFSSSTDASGQITISLNNGSSLVFDGAVSELSTTVNPSDPSTLMLSLTSGTFTIDVTNIIQGGQIAGLYKSQAALQQTQNAIGRLSISIMSSLNVQNKLGVDYNSNLGGNIFNDINMSSATKDRVIANLNNTSSVDVNVTITNVSQLKTSDYNVVFDTPTHYTMTRISDNSVVSSGTIGALPTQISVDGFSINLNSGSIAAGDKFIISPNRNMGSKMQVVISDPKLLALGWPVKGEKDIANKGNGSINVTSVVDTTNSAFSLSQQLNPPINIRFLTATTYELVNANDNTIIEGPLTYDPLTVNNVFPTAGAYDPGYRISLSGTIEAGDEFHIQYNANAKGDNDNGRVMEDLYQKGVLEGGSMSFGQAYNLLSSDVAITVNAASGDYRSSQAIYAAAYGQYSQVSGVNAMEENTNLGIYQQCYQASAQVLQVAKSVFDTIINIGRG